MMNNQQTNQVDLEQFKAEIFKNMKFIAPIAGIIFLLVLGKTTFYTVEPDEEAVVVRFGKYTETTSPGLHFKMPLGIDKVFFVKTKRVLQEEFGFRTKSTSSRRAADVEMLSLSTSCGKEMSLPSMTSGHTYRSFRESVAFAPPVERLGKGSPGSTASNCWR